MPNEQTATIEQRVIQAASGLTYANNSNHAINQIAQKSGVNPVTVCRILANDRAQNANAFINASFSTSGLLVVNHGGLKKYYDLTQLISTLQPLYIEQAK